MCARQGPVQADDEAKHQGGDPEEAQLRHGPLLAERLHHSVPRHQELDQKGKTFVVCFMGVFSTASIFNCFSFSRSDPRQSDQMYHRSQISCRIVIIINPI